MQPNLSAGSSSSQPFPPRAPGSLHTPSTSFSDAVHTPDDKQAKEYEVAKSRLTDAKFNMRDYADPLAPGREVSQSHHHPKSVNAETEQRLLAIVAQVKDKHS
ncbi:hypothetical protein F5Y18DRAFT_432966 [Xylariaceae sp. FL1019]|nr:hypothetical protein F5Y18DRAFT_432966 [Xylariaceae sp. FL1019]